MTNYKTIRNQKANLTRMVEGRLPNKPVIMWADVRRAVLAVEFDLAELLVAGDILDLLEDICGELYVKYDPRHPLSQRSEAV